MQEVHSYRNLLQSFLLPKNEEEVVTLNTLQLDRVIALAQLLLLLVHLEVNISQIVRLDVAILGIEGIMSW